MRLDSQHPLHVLEAQGYGAGRGMSVSGAGVVISAAASARNVFDEHGDGARGLLQGLVGVVGVHHGRGPGSSPPARSPLSWLRRAIFSTSSGSCCVFAAITKVRPPVWTEGAQGESSWFVPGALPARRWLGRLLVGSVRACGSSTTRCRVAGRGPGAVAAGCRALGVWLGGGACEVPPPSSQPPEGPAVAIIPCSPVGSDGRPLDPAEPVLTGGCADQSTSVSHAERTIRGPLGDISGTPARRALVDDRDGHKRPTTTPGWLALGARQGLLDTGVRGVRYR